jgi:hypothetical protein
MNKGPSVPSSCNCLWMQWVGNGKRWIVWGPTWNFFVFNVTIQVEVCFTVEPRDIQDARTVLQLFFMLRRKRVKTVSAAFCKETTRHHGRLSIHCWLGPQQALLNRAQFSWSSSYRLSLFTHNFFSTRRWGTFASLRMYVTHTSSFFRLFDNPVDTVCWWWNRNRKLSTILSVRSNTRTTKSVKGFGNKHFLIRHIRRHLVAYSGFAISIKFPNCVERSLN